MRNKVITGPTHFYSQNIASSLSHALQDTKYRAFEFLLKDIPSSVFYTHPRDIFNHTFSLYNKIFSRQHYINIKILNKIKNLSYFLLRVHGLINRNFLWLFTLMKTTIFPFVLIIYMRLFNKNTPPKKHFIDNWIERQVILRMYAEMAEKHYTDILKITYVRSKYGPMSSPNFKVSPKPDFKTLYKLFREKPKKPVVTYQEPEDRVGPKKEKRKPSKT